MSWTDERVEQLKTLWAEGHSASQIAKTMGGVTRNAVIGKVHRLGLSNRTQPPVEKEKKEVVSAQEKSVVTNMDRIKQAAQEHSSTPPPKRVELSIVASREEETSEQDVKFEQLEDEEVRESAARAAELAKVEAQSLKLSLMELNERTCKWPIGDPATDDFYFCGLPCEAGKSYCKGHAKAAYQPVTSRRDRARNKKRIVASGGALISRF